MEIKDHIRELVMAPSSELVKDGVGRLAEIEALKRLEAMKLQMEAEEDAAKTAAKRAQKWPLFRKLGVVPRALTTKVWRFLRSPGTIGVLVLLFFALVTYGMLHHRSKAVMWGDVVANQVSFRQDPEGPSLSLEPLLAAHMIEIDGEHGLLLEGDYEAEDGVDLTRIVLRPSDIANVDLPLDGISLKKIEAPPGSKWKIDATLRPYVGLTIESEGSINVAFSVSDDAVAVGVARDRTERELTQGSLRLRTQDGDTLRIKIHGHALVDVGDGIEFHGATEASIVDLDFCYEILNKHKGKDVPREASAIQSGTVTFDAYAGSCTPRELRYRETIEMEQVKGELLRLRILSDGLAVAWTGMTWGFRAGSRAEPKPASPTEFQYFVGEEPRGYVVSLFVSAVLALIFGLMMVVARKFGGESAAATLLECGPS